MFRPYGSHQANENSEVVNLLLYIPQSYRDIIEGLQDIVAVLETQLRPLVQAELSVLVDILPRPELLFPVDTEARKQCEDGAFISK